MKYKLYKSIAGRFIGALFLLLFPFLLTFFIILDFFEVLWGSIKFFGSRMKTKLWYHRRDIPGFLKDCWEAILQKGPNWKDENANESVHLDPHRRLRQRARSK